MKWWIERALQIVAIVAPFFLAFLVLSKQITSQQEYEQQKLKQILLHLEREVRQNSVYTIDNDSTSLETIVPKVKILKQGRGTIYRFPVTRFSTVVWEAANSKDYFFHIQDTLAVKLSNLYSAFYGCNKQLDLLSSLEQHITSGFNSPELATTLQMTALDYSIRATHHIDIVKADNNDVLSSLENQRELLDAPQQESGVDMWTTTIQILVTLLGGGIIVWVYQWYKDRQNSTRIRSLFLIEIHQNIVTMQEMTPELWWMTSLVLDTIYKANSHLLTAFDDRLIVKIATFYANLAVVQSNRSREHIAKELEEKGEYERVELYKRALAVSNQEDRTRIISLGNEIMDDAKKLGYLK